MSTRVRVFFVNFFAWLERSSFLDVRPPPTLWVKIVHRKKWTWIGIFKPAKPSYLVGIAISVLCSIVWKGHIVWSEWMNEWILNALDPHTPKVGGKSQCARDVVVLYILHVGWINARVSIAKIGLTQLGTISQGTGRMRRTNEPFHCTTTHEGPFVKHSRSHATSA